MAEPGRGRRPPAARPPPKGSRREEHDHAAAKGGDHAVPERLIAKATAGRASGSANVTERFGRPAS
jgi:hypothetical protein